MVRTPSWYWTALVGLLLLCAPAWSAPLPTVIPPEIVILKPYGRIITLLPFAEIIGATVERNGDIITVRRNERTFTCSLGQTNALAGTKAIQLPMPVTEAEGTIFVSFDPLIKALGGSCKKSPPYKLAPWATKAIRKPSYAGMTGISAGSVPDMDLAGIRVTMPGMPVPPEMLCMTLTAEPPKDAPEAPRPPLAEMLRQAAKMVEMSPIYIVPTDGKPARRFSYSMLSTLSPLHFSQDGKRWLRVQGAMAMYLALETATDEMRTPLRLSLIPKDTMLIPFGTPTLSPDGATLMINACIYDTKRIDEVIGKSPSQEDMKALQADISACVSYELIGLSTDGKRWVRYARNAQNPCWSPDGTLIAYETTGDTPKIVLMDAREPVPGLSIRQEIGEGSSPRFSPDGKHLLFLHNSRIVVAHFGATPTDVTLSEPPETAPEEDNPNFTPDSRAILFATADGLRRMNADRTGEAALIEHTEGRHPICSPDGQYVYFIRKDAEDADTQAICRLNLATKEVTPLAAFSDTANIILSPDGKHLYVVEMNFGL